jgi:FkbM family methyltransferase
MLQKSLAANSIWFEVHNPTEANRVYYLDDEEDFLSDLLSDLQKDDIFFDVGACIGVYALHAAHRCKHIFAFEPDPGFREHLEQNVAINNLENITILPYAISDKSGVLTLFTDGVGGKSPSLENNDFQNSIEVEARTLSELVSSGLLPCPSVIKMDIEGAEILALRGTQELFATKPPRLIFLELHPTLLPHFGSNSMEVLSLLERAGYRIKLRSERDAQVHYIFGRMDSKAN